MKMRSVRGRPRRTRRALCVLTSVLVTAAAFLTPGVSDAQAAAASGNPTTGSIVGTVTASNASGATINVANTLVQLWTTDAVTEATRDSACAMWLSDKSIWMQAKGEAESPSGVNWTGTAVGNDLRILRALLALRRDTVRTDANGAFAFRNVPFGAYTIEAEAFANDRFLQWTADAPVIPPRKTEIKLDSSTVMENQYCAVVRPQADSSSVNQPGAADRGRRPTDTRLRETTGYRQRKR